MRKVLFGSTALIGAVMLAGTASAQTAGPKAPFTAILDGEANANFGILSGTQNSGTNGGHQRDFGMESNVWLRFALEAKADNGLTYGWNVRTIGSSSSISFDGFANDREGIYLRHPAWGLVSIGNDTSTGKQGFPTVNADWGPATTSQSYFGPDSKLEGMFLQTTDTRAFAIYNGFIKDGSDDAFPSGRAMHIWYGSPDWNGLSIQADYQPDGTSRNEEQFVTSTQSGAPSASQNLNSTNFQNVVSTNLQYRAEIMGVALQAGIQYAHGQSKNLFTATGSNQAFKDINSFETGFKTNYAGFQFGLMYTWYGQTGTPKAITNSTGPIGKVNDTWGWSTGLEYFTGPWVVGGYYWFGRAAGTYQLSAAGTALTNIGGVTAGNGGFEINNYGVGVGYTVAPGLKLYGELFYYDYYNTHITVAAPGGPNNGRHMNGQVYILGTSLAW